tara:strand:- start:182 stop:454 length:273 start_codon:yes stop_codon:yes gene_type:complete
MGIDRFAGPSVEIDCIHGSTVGNGKCRADDVAGHSMQTQLWLFRRETLVFVIVIISEISLRDSAFGGTCCQQQRNIDSPMFGYRERPCGG